MRNPSGNRKVRTGRRNQEKKEWGKKKTGKLVTSLRIRLGKG